MEREVTITYLEMTSPSDAVPYERPRRLEVRRAELPCPELNRMLYLAVGGDWWWHSRLGWERERWLDWVDRPELETWLGYLRGTPVGYFELERQPGNQVELVYFGLLPTFIGRGLGGELLAAAVERAWTPGTERVWVHTCTLDHPSALPNYRARGFRIYDTHTIHERLPDARPSLWQAGRHP
ncbi:MAG TPA: GNAT family N-acetyltransferase [Longimicrobiales bacterium]|nr:GNAT family N-acetyltransferase [Longimicrobiales bacterium]